MTRDVRPLGAEMFADPGNLILGNIKAIDLKKIKLKFKKSLIYNERIFSMLCK